MLRNSNVNKFEFSFQEERMQRREERGGGQSLFKPYKYPKI